jgi:hypothetical protein
MTATAALIVSLDVITAETTTMLTVLDDATASPDRREAKRRVLEIRASAQELFDWLSVIELEETRN